MPMDRARIYEAVVEAARSLERATNGKAHDMEGRCWNIDGERAADTLFARLDELDAAEDAEL